MKKDSNDPFTEAHARKYDERNASLAPISGCLHFLTGLVLRKLPARSRILCVGAGTGAEIIALARAQPEWSFVALEPSAAMLSVCRERLVAAGVMERCELVHGYIQDLPPMPDFDAALSLLVAHFVKHEDRLPFLRHIHGCLKSGGVLVTAEISFDLDSAAFPSMLGHWEGVQSLMGATPESLAKLPALLRDVLTVLPPSETERLLRESGFQTPVRFFQALMISGWYATKA